MIENLVNGLGICSCAYRHTDTKPRVYDAVIMKSHCERSLGSSDVEQYKAAVHPQVKPND